MTTNKTDFSKLKQMSIIKFFSAEKCNLYEIYRKRVACIKKHVEAQNIYK